MIDHKEQANSLREHADLIETSIELYGPSATRLLVYDLRNAAAAIEELQFELDCVNDSVKMLSLPIDGKWIRVEDNDSYHYECSRCGERPLYSRYGDVVLSGTCPMCGAKMEVQE